MFITFEGIEGVGKTTNIQFVKQLLIERGFDVILTREPGGTQAGEMCREILLSNKIEPLNAITELLLLFAARSQHIETVIKPALAAKKIVLCDRFTDASFAYQGGGRGIADLHIKNLQNLVQGDIKPDLTLLLDLPVEVGLERAHGRGAADRFEREEKEFFVRVRDKYLEMAKAEPDRFVIIDANCQISDVQKQLNVCLDKFLKNPIKHESAV